LPQPNADIQVSFRIKYVAEGVAYLEGGRSAGLAEGVQLSVKDTDPITGHLIGHSTDSADADQKPVAALYIFAVAESSACRGDTRSYAGFEAG